MALRVPRRRFTVEEFHRMADARVISEDDRVELLEGEIIEMAAIGSRHASCVDRLNRLFMRAVGEQAIVRVQNPMVLDEWSQPQPDLILIRPRADFYAAGHPGPADVLLAVEVADASLEADRGVKVPLYARHGVPEVWLVDLEDRSIEAFRDPSPAGYRTRGRCLPGQSLTPQTLPSISVPIDPILP